MYTAGRIPRRVSRHARWILSTLVMVLILCGCTASRPARRVRASPRVPAAVIPVTAAYLLEEIQPVSFSETTQVALVVNGPVQPLVQRFSQPERLVIDLPETQLALQGDQPE